MKFHIATLPYSTMGAWVVFQFQSAWVKNADAPDMAPAEDAHAPASAIASISTITPFGRRDTWTQDRAGFVSPNSSA